MDTTASSRPQRRRPFARGMLAAGVLATSCTAALAAGPYAYIPSYFDDAISVIDLSAPMSTVPPLTVANATGTGLYGVAVNDKAGLVYITDDYNESVYKLNTATGATLQSYVVGPNPHGIAIDPSGKHLYVAVFATASLAIIDTSTGAISNVDFDSLTNQANPSPQGVALNLAGTRLYVTDTSVGHRLCRINVVTPPDSLSDSDCVTVGENDSAQPTGLALSPDGTRAYVVIHGNGSAIAVVDTASLTVLRTISLGLGSPNAIAVSASGKRGYVGTSLGKIVALDLTHADDPNQNPVMGTVADPDEVLSSIQGVSISQDGTRLLAADNGASKLHFIDIVDDANTIVQSVDVIHGPKAVGQFTPSDAIFVSGFQKSG